MHTTSPAATHDDLNRAYHSMRAEKEELEVRLVALETRLAQRQGVTVTGIDVGFGDWVILLVKLALASIPAAIIFATFGLFMSFVLSVLGFALFR